MSRKREPKDPRASAMSPVERVAEVHKAAKLKQMSVLWVVRELWGVSYSHARLVLQGERKPSRKLAEKISAFVGIDPHVFFGRDQFNEQSTPIRRARNE